MPETSRHSLGANAKRSSLMGSPVSCLRQSAWFFLAAAFTTYAGCANSKNASDIATPTVTQIRQPAAAVGTRVQFVGTDFIDPSEGWVDILWQGQFIRDDGGSEDVDLVVPLFATTPNEVVWENFGLNRIPFGECAKGGRCSTGIFKGTVSAVNRSFEGGKSARSSGLDVGNTNKPFTVAPSLVVREFRPFDEEKRWIANCALPATDTIGGLSYVLGVEAVGFDFNAVDYFIAGGGVEQDGQIRKDDVTISYQSSSAAGRRHQILLRLAPVPDMLPFGYKTTVLINAHSGNNTYQLSYPFMVRKQVTWFPEGRKVAEILPPERVGGCINGGLSGVSVTYTDAESVTKQVSTSSTTATNWQDVYSTAYSQAFSDSLSSGRSEAVSDGTTTTDARTDSGFNSGQEFSNISSGWSLVDSLGNSRNSNAGSSVMSEISNLLRNESGMKPNDLFTAIQHAQQDTSQDQGFVSGQDTGTSGGRVVNVGSNGAAGAGLSSGEAWSEMTGTAVSNAVTTGQHLARTSSYSDSLSQSEATSRGFAEAQSTGLSFSSSVLTSDSRTWNIPGGMYGQKFRQATRYVTAVSIVMHDLCGNRAKANSVFIDSWEWSADISWDQVPPGGRCDVLDCMPPAECLMKGLPGNGSCDGKYPPADKQPKNATCQAIRNAASEGIGELRNQFGGKRRSGS